MECEIGKKSWYSRKMHWEAGGKVAPLYGGLLLVPCFLCFTHQISSSHLMLLWCSGHSLILYHIPHFIVWEHFSQKINIALKKKFFLLDCSWFTVLFFLLYSKVNQYTRIHRLLDPFLIEVITKYWVDFSVLYSRSSLVIYFTHCVIVVGQLLSCVRLFAALQVLLSLAISRSWLKFMSIQLVMPLTIASSATLFFFCLPSFPASGSFAMSQLFASGDQSHVASALASSVLPMIFRVDFL